MTASSQEPLAAAGVALLALGITLGTWRLLSPRGPWHGPARRYLAGIERDLGLLFSTASAREVAAAQIALGLAAAAGAVLWDARIWLLVPIAAAAPRWWLTVMKRRRIEQIEQQLDGWLVVMANMLRVTGSVPDAIRHTTALCRPPLGQELDLVLKELRVGVSVTDALRAMAARVGSSMMSTAVTILVLGRQTGGELPRLIDETAAAFRERLRLESVVRKQTAMGRTQLAVLFVGPAAIVWMFHGVDPTYFAPLQSTSTGQALAAVAATLWITSIAIARKVLSVDV